MMQLPKNIDTVVYPQGTTKNIMEAIMRCYNSDYRQVEPMCKDIATTSVIDKCRDVFDLVNDNITYNQDPLGKQYIRTPARLWHDKEGDCKSFAIFIGSCMRCMGIPHVFRFASYSDKPDPTHVYIVAFDGNKEIIIDPVYRVRGVALFNQECIYKTKTDMAGTTEISYLAGIGYPGQSEAVIYPQTDTSPDRKLADLYFNLNLLSQWNDIANREDNTEYAAQVLNRMDLCSLAICCFSMGATGVINTDQGLTYLLSLYRNGRFDTPEYATLAEREIVLSVIYSQIVTESGKFESDSDSFITIYKITGADLVNDLMSYSQINTASLGNISGNYDDWQEEGQFDSYKNLAKIHQTLKDSAEYFIYTFIPESELSQYKDVVAQKRAQHIRILSDIQDSGFITVSQSEAVIFSAIRANWGLTPEQFLKAIKDGDIPVVGLALASILAIIGACVALIGALAPILIAVFNKDKFVDDVKLYAPEGSDGLYTATDPDYNWSTGGGGFTTAGSTLLPLLLIGGLIVGLASSGKKKKKKK